MASLRRHLDIGSETLERRRSIPLCHKSVIEAAFGGFGFRGVVGAGASAFGHHHPALGAGVDFGWFPGPQLAGGSTQGGKQRLAAGVGGVGVPGG
jgi:hypothetical protein